MINRNLLKRFSFLTATASGQRQVNTVHTMHINRQLDVSDDRAYWIDKLTQITSPVLSALAEEKLKTTMPVETQKGQEHRKSVTHLEAFARSLAGIAPWLSLGADDTPEGKIRAEYITLAQTAIKHAVNPASRDFLNFTVGEQPLVDAAFLAHAILRAPKQLWHELDQTTQQCLIPAFTSTRHISVKYSNWLLFPAMIETALLKFGHSADVKRIDYALQQHEHWYAGDGLYSDGPNLRMDYYNGYVIQPMLLDIVQHVYPTQTELINKLLKRSQRYAEVQERLIAPDGTFPPMGRSITYRCGAFQVLAQLALQKRLPASLPPHQVRSALTAVIHRTIDAPETFDANGWLRIGLCGHQPGLGERYITTGSLYVCSTAFLPLGLPESDDFWKLPSTDWTSRKIFQGMDVQKDKPFDL